MTYSGINSMANDTPKAKYYHLAEDPKAQKNSRLWQVPKSAKLLVLWRRERPPSSCFN